MTFLIIVINFLTTPSNMFFCLIFLGLFALVIWWRRTALICLAMGVAGFGLLGYTSLSEVLIAPLVARFPPIVLEDASPPFGLIVLGGGMNEVHAAHNNALMDLGDGGEAVPIAVLLAKRFPSAKILLIDGAGSTPSPYRPAEGMERVMTAFGISPDRISIDPVTMTTQDRVRSALSLIGDDRDQDWWVIAPSHRMPRIIGVFRAHGFEPIPYPIDFEWIPPFDPFYRYALLDGLRLTDKGAHEWRGLLFYHLRGYTSEFFPGP
ncbi:hypothetical protein RA28_10540 [Ruegeria sp. ANG-S4]|uniref:YdcF family protein n=1 Tax=Ruegeria sp. ANG-S4 TaxID=1577904 RepID=UPI00057E778E|nr:ElyC/SanA/YdcF family protein [Ruegeria sp. ANG-S4]KIC45509.1 hypothetical protein RA28_10540 [Ruegeria sp. ANG-S4]